MSYLKWKRFGSHKLDVPERATPGAGGYDLAWSGRLPTNVEVDVTKAFYLYPGERFAMPTGWAVEIPSGWVGIIRERSGKCMAGLSVHAGVVDDDYRGEVHVVVSNGKDNGQLFLVPGVAFAEIVIVPCLQWESREVDELSPTVRGGNGFGSTDVKR